jgi:hypothetical protein
VGSAERHHRYITVEQREGESLFDSIERIVGLRGCSRRWRNAVKGLIVYAGFVIAWTAAGVLISSYIERITSPQISTIVLLAMFFSGLVVSWIATVFVMDGSLKNFKAEREQLEAERIGRDYMNRTNQG